MPKETQLLGRAYVLEAGNFNSFIITLHLSYPDRPNEIHGILDWNTSFPSRLDAKAMIQQIADQLNVSLIGICDDVPEGVE